MKSIPTAYKGYHFRSRLEARYAVLFDELKLRWDYEIEGFFLPFVGPYLPDFHLRDLDLWVEVKGGNPNLQDCDKARALALHKNCAVLVLFGVPRTDWPKEYGRLFAWNEKGELEAINCGGFIFAERGVSLDAACGPDVYTDRSRSNPLRVVSPNNPIGSNFSTSSECERARSARFEFGESGATL